MQQYNFFSIYLKYALINLSLYLCLTLARHFRDEFLIFSVRINLLTSDNYLLFTCFFSKQVFVRFGFFLDRVFLAAEKQKNY
jgi:hypothetical protein